MNYFGELVWRKENKEYLIISMRKLIKLHLKFNYIYDMTSFKQNILLSKFLHSESLSELTVTFQN